MSAEHPAEGVVVEGATEADVGGDGIEDGVAGDLAALPGAMSNQATAVVNFYYQTLPAIPKS